MQYKMNEGVEAPQFIIYGSLVGMKRGSPDRCIRHPLRRVVRCYRDWRQKSGKVLKGRISRFTIIGGSQSCRVRPGFQIIGEIPLAADDQALSTLRGLVLTLAETFGIDDLTVWYKGKSYTISSDPGSSFST